MSSVGASGSIAQKLKQIEMVTELISSSSVSASGDGPAESSGGSIPSEVGNLMNVKS